MECSNESWNHLELRRSSFLLRDQKAEGEFRRDRRLGEGGIAPAQSSLRSAKFEKSNDPLEIGQNFGDDETLLEGF